MIKVAYLIDTIISDNAGTEKQLIEIIRRIDKTSFEVSLICLWESDWMRNNKLPCSCYILGYQGFFSISFPKVVRRLTRIIAEKQIQIVQTFFEDSIFVAWLCNLFTKQRTVLLSSRRDMGLDRKNLLWYHHLYAWVLPYISQQFNGIVANSDRVCDYVVKREKIFRGKIKVIYNGVNIPEFTGVIPAVFQKNKAEVWLGIVASLVPVKRHDVLIKALSRLCASGILPTVRVVVIGMGGGEDKLRVLARGKKVDDLLHFEGAVSNVPDYLQNIDIGVLCSDREGLSNAILEYMACGLPVVATAVGGNTELVSADNGRCVPADDPAALTDALLELVLDKKKRQRMGEASLRRVKEDHSWQESMKYLEDYYQTLITERG